MGQLQPLNLLKAMYMSSIRRKSTSTSSHTKHYFLMHCINSIFCLFAFIILSMPVYADVLKDIIKSGTLRVGVSLHKPWAFRDDKGNLEGFEIQMAKQLANDIGVQPKFITVEWSELINSLESKKIDIIISGMAITPERALRLNFSDPYAEAGIDLAASLLKTEHINSLDELNDSKITVGVVLDTVSEKLAKKLFNQATVKSFNLYDEAEKSILNGEIHVLIDSTPIPRYLALEYPSKVDTPLKEPLLVYKTGMAVNKGEQEFLNFLNAWITSRDADNWISSRYKFWFESLEWKKDNDKNILQ